jgi:tetratricopeptide (TPR) repeat protein
MLETEKEIIKDEITLDSALDDKYDLAYEKFHSGYYSESITICNEIIEKQKNHYKAFNIKGIAIAFSDDFENGMKNIDKSIELNDSYWYSRFNKALAYSYNKDFENGIIWYDKSLELNDYCWSYYGKAAIYGQLNDVDKAVENLKSAIDLNESVKNNAKYEKDFNLIKDEESFKDLLD